MLNYIDLSAHSGKKATIADNFIEAVVVILTRIVLLASILSSAAFGAAPLTCPADHIAQGKPPPAGHEWKCTTKDGIVDGLWLTWYGDKQLLSERHMKLGKEHGPQRMWWPNGQLMMDGISVEGHRYQGFKYWSADGKPAQLEVQTETVNIKQ